MLFLKLWENTEVFLNLGIISAVVHINAQYAKWFFESNS